MVRYIALLLMFLASNIHCQAATQMLQSSIFDLGSYYFKSVSFSRDNISGVSSSFIEDDDGFIWIGTTDGILRYDGYFLRTFKHDEKNKNTLSGHRINTMYKARNGLIYIGTNANGLSVFNPKTEKFTNFKHDSNKTNSLSNNSVRAITGDSKGGIWLGTNNGLDYFDTKNQQFTHYQHDENIETSINDNHIRSLLIDNKEQLWVGTWKGLNKFSFKNKTFEQVLSSPNEENSLATQIVYTIFQSADDKIWLGTADNGAAWITPKDQYNSLNWLNTLPSNKAKTTAPWVTSMIQISDTSIWMSTYGGGIIVVNTQTGEITQQIVHDKFTLGSINQNEISTLYLDTSGIVWVGNWGQGLNTYNTKNAAFRTLRHSPKNKHGLSTDEVFSMLTLDNGLIWLGTNNNGIDIFDPEIGLVDGLRPKLGKADHLQGDGVLALAQTVSGDIWVGTRHQGLYKYQPLSHNFKHYTANDGIDVKGVTRLWATPNGDLWIASDVSLYRYSEATNKFTPQLRSGSSKAFFGASINAIRHTNDGSIWVGGVDGLFVALKGTDLLLPIVDKKGEIIPALSQQINSLVIDDKNQMWVSNNRDKLFLISDWYENSIDRSDISNIAFSDNITSYSPVIHDEQNRLWSSEGVLDIATGKSIKLDVSNGIDIGNEYYGNFSQTNDNKFLFGGSSGLLIIDPTRFTPWTLQPKSVISKLKVDGKLQILPTNTSLILPPTSKSISFEFAALDYSAPEKLKYAYQLDGYDDDWRETTIEQRTTTYTNLPPGEYIFRVKSTTRNGQWSNNQAALRFIQEAMWYQTWFAKVILILIILFAFYLTLQYRLNRLKQQKLVLQQKVDRRTADILMLSEVGKELTSSHQKDEVGTKLYESLSKIMPVDGFLLGMVIQEKNSIQFPTVIDEDKVIGNFELSIDNVERLAVQTVINSQEYVLLCDNDLNKYDFTDRITPLTNNKMCSVIYLPLIINGKTIGVLSVQSRFENAFTQTNIEMLRTLSSYTAVAIDNVLAYAQIEDKNDALNQAVKNLESVTYTDQLTGAHNRRFIEKHLPPALSILTRQRAHDQSVKNQDYGFLLIDIDHFKNVNDTYGHEAGDKVLCQLVDVISKSCRTSDWVVRWGGEEFLVVCKYTERSFLKKTAERIRKNIENHSFDLGNGKSINKTCSIGIAPVPSINNNFQAITWQQSLNIADMALYTAKTHGRNAWVELYYNPENKDVIPYDDLTTNMQNHIEQKHILFSTSIINQKITIKL